MRIRLLAGIPTAAMGPAILGTSTLPAADRSILVPSPAADDDRIAPAHEAVAFQERAIGPSRDALTDNAVV